MSDHSSTPPNPQHAQIFPEQLLRIPSVHFFTQRVVIPDDSEKDEVLDYLELQLEENSPFPLDQLAWGYWQEGPEALLYAAPAKIVNQAIEEHAETMRWVIPAFLPYVISHTENSGRYCWVDEEAASSLLIYREGDNIPHSILSSDSQEDRLSKLCDQVQRYGIDGFSRSSLRKFPQLSYFRAPRRQVSFVKEGQPRADAHHILSLSLLQGDLRDKEFILKETSRRKVGLLLWKTSLALAALFVFLLIGQGGLWWQQSQTVALRETLSENAPQAQIVEEKQALVRKLKETSSTPLQPFELLQAINKFRPKTIHFTSASFTDSGSMRLDGNAMSIEEVNQYFSAIEGSSIFNSVNLSNLESRDNRGVRFKLTLDR